jgi:hypothetical protein
MFEDIRSLPDTKQPRILRIFISGEAGHALPMTPCHLPAEIRSILLQPPCSDKQDRINTPVVLAIVRNLSPLPPHDLPTCRHNPQLGNVYLDDRSLGQYAELCVHGVLWVLFDGYDGELDGYAEFGVGYVGFLVSQAHGADEAFVFGISVRIQSSVPPP